MKEKSAIFVGNDVVDLTDADSVDILNNKRVMLRALNSNELHFVENSDNQLVAFWSVWAAKESAFKALSQRFPDVLFIPKNFHVSENFSEVKYRHIKLKLQIDKNNSYIHALCVLGKSPIDSIKYWIRPKDFILQNYSKEIGIDVNQSTLVRILLKKEIQKIFPEVSTKNILISKMENHSAPKVSLQNASGETNLSASFSHHGEYLATAIQLPNGVLS